MLLAAVSESPKKSVFFKKARWVVPPEAVGGGKAGPGWFLFRAPFSFSNKSSSARLLIAAESKYWLYVNGQCAVREGGLKRGPSPEASYFDVVDLTPWLCEGGNTAAILLWHFGKSGFSHLDSGRAGLLAEIQDAEGDVLAASGASWRVAAHPSFFPVDYLRDGYRLSESCLGFDARLEPAGWEGVDFDDSAWPAAEEAGELGAEPWGRLVEREIPQWRWGECAALREVSRETEADGRMLIKGKLPANLQYVPWIEVEAPAGERVEMFSSLCTGRMQAVYVTRQGRQTYEAMGWMNGEDLLVRCSQAVRVLAFGYRETGYGAAFVGEFLCDDEFLNRMYKKARRTLYITMRDTFMDCPCRERAQWPGDMVVQLGQIPYCLGRPGELLVRKGLLEFVKWQKPDGVLYGPVPGNWDKELPAQMLALLSRYGAWTYYMDTGDRSLLEEFLPAAMRYLQVWKKTAEGVIAYRKGGWDWVDWGENFDGFAMLNAWYALALEGTCRIAAELGKNAEAWVLEAELCAFRKAFGCVFNHGPEGIYSLGLACPPDDRVQALAVLAGLYDPSQRSALTELLLERREASPYMEKYVLEALFCLCRPDLALARMRDRFEPMIASEHTTLWENWGGPGSGSTINHSWSGGPLTLVCRKFAGLAPLSPGWQRVRVRPQPGPLRYLEASVETEAGKVRVALKREEGWRIELELPEGCSADVDLTQMGERAGFFCKELGGARPKAVGPVFQAVPAGKWSFLPLIS